MKIEGKDPLHLLETYLLGKAKPQGGAQALTPNTDGQTTSDRVDISQNAAEYQKLSARVASTPEIRMELVADLKRKIESGNYDVNREQIAEKLIRSTLIDQIL